MLMPSIKSFAVFEGVTETVVPGQTRTSPPLDKYNTAVSLPAVRDDPAANRLPDNTTSPTPLVTGTTAGVAAGVNASTCGGWKGDFLLAVFGSLSVSPGGFSRTISRFQATYPLYPNGHRRPGT